MTITLGGYPLERWRQAIEFHPWHFWQAQNEEMAPVGQCGDIVFEYAWQRLDQLGRQDLRQGLHQAIRQLARELAYYPLPLEVQEETSHFAFMPSNCISVRLDTGLVRQIGYYEYELMDTLQWGGGGLQRYDEDGDDFAEMGFASYLPEAETDDLIFVSDGILTEEEVTSTTLERHQIYPVRRLNDENGEQLGYIFPLPQAIEFSERQRLRPEGIEIASDEADEEGLGQVLVYRRTVSTTDAITFRHSALCSCSEGTSTASTSYRIDNARTGHITARIPCTCCRPIAVQVRYIAGDDLAKWSTIIAQLATANLTRVLCNCEMANRTLTYWQNDYADQPEGQTFLVSPENLNNPFGTRVGQIAAWLQVVNSKQLRALRF